MNILSYFDAVLFFKIIIKVMGNAQCSVLPKRVNVLSRQISENIPIIKLFNHPTKHTHNRGKRNVIHVA